LTLAEAESLALNNNPTLTAASARVAVVRGQLRQAWLYPNPMLGYSGMEIGDDGTAGQHGAMVSQNIITGGKRRLDRAALAQEVQHREAAFAAQRLRVLTDVRLRFNEALVAQRQLELLRELVEIADEAVKATERLAEVKQIPLHVLLQTQIEAENARVLLDNAQTEFAEALQRLLAVMAVPDFEIGEVSGELTTGLPMLEFGEVLKGILGNSPELAAAWADVRRGEYLLTRARREPIPDLEVAAAVRYSAISEFTNADLNLRIPLPIFDRNQGNIDKAQAELAMAHAEVRRIELDLTDRLAMVFRGYEFARQAVRRYEEEIIPRARRSLELIDEGYRVGQSDYLALLTAQRTYTQVTLEHLRAVRQLRENGFRIEGQLLSGSLMPSP
jgi:cobalt-zinc-cadmium efflux system outer membrane protein